MREGQHEEGPAESQHVDAEGDQSPQLPDTVTQEDVTPSTVPGVTEVKAGDIHQEPSDSLPSASHAQHESSEESKPDEVAEQTQQRRVRHTTEDAEDAYPEEDEAAAPVDVSMGGDCYPAEDTAAPPSDVSLGEDSHPAEDTAAAPVEMADEGMYQQQASSIVETVLSRALMDVARQPPAQGQDAGEEEGDASPPPPLPDDGPPPLPGAPPPPLILRDNTERLVAAEDLVGMLPSQEAASAKSSPRSSREEPPSSAEASPRVDVSSADVIESDDAEVEVNEAVKADTSAPNFTSPVQQSPSEVEPQESQNRDPQAVTGSDVVISFDPTPSSEPLPLSVNTDLLGGGLRGKDGELEQQHGDNPPVSDTLSQDSGVQDEDMSEDGLRFSQDESPTSNVDSAAVFDAAMTPDEVPASLLLHDDAAQDAPGGGRDGVEVHVEAKVTTVTAKSPPVPSPRVTLSHAPLPSSAPPSPDPNPPAESPAVAPPPPPPAAADVESVDDSVSQDSASPRCSSARQEAETSARPGGVSTTGDGGQDDGLKTHDGSVRDRGRVGVVVVDADGKKKDEGDVQSARTGHSEEVSHHQLSERDDAVTQPNSSEDGRSQIAPEPPKSAPPPPPPQEENEEAPSQQHKEEDPSSDGAEVVSCRKWCILDQSGSLFLHGASDSRVAVSRATLRQVSSMRPGHVAAMLAAGNRDLDAARLPKTLELRVVSARGLNGRVLSVDITQREDYFVQVSLSCHVV